MDRSWIFKDRRTSKAYKDGVEEFYNLAVNYARDLQSIRCPCKRCGNIRRQPIQEIKIHLFRNGMDESYSTWTWHGESVANEAPPSSNAQDSSHQKFDTHSLDDVADTIEMVEAAYNHSTNDPKMFRKLLEDAEKPLYPNCTKFTKLSALVKLYNFKANSGMSNTHFSDMLMLFGDMLPANNELPLSIYETNKSLAALGMEYEKIHACPNDCVLYRKELKDATSCLTCETSRWKLKKIRLKRGKVFQQKFCGTFHLSQGFVECFNQNK